MLRFDATKLLRGMEASASEILLQAGQDIYEISQELVPVDTGALKQSGGVEPVTSTEVNIGYGNGPVDYAGYVEYGTGTSPAQPYLTPAMAQAQSIIEKRAGEIILKHLTKS